MDALAAGVSRRAAANGAGVSLTAFKNWLAWGRDGEKPYVDFVARVEAAEAKAEREMVDCIFLAAKEGKHDAAKFWLTSRRASDYAAKVATESEESASEEQAADDIEVTRSVLAALESRKATG